MLNGFWNVHPCSEKIKIGASAVPLVILTSQTCIIPQGIGTLNPGISQMPCFSAIFCLRILYKHTHTNFLYSSGMRQICMIAWGVFTQSINVYIYIYIYELYISIIHVSDGPPTFYNPIYFFNKKKPVSHEFFPQPFMALPEKNSSPRSHGQLSVAQATYHLSRLVSGPTFHGNLRVPTPPQAAT